jgi:hypothetical protein
MGHTRPHRLIPRFHDASASDTHPWCSNRLALGWRGTQAKRQ